MWEGMKHACCSGVLIKSYRLWQYWQNINSSTLKWSIAACTVQNVSVFAWIINKRFKIIVKFASFQLWHTSLEHWYKSRQSKHQTQTACESGWPGRELILQHNEWIESRLKRRGNNYFPACRFAENQCRFPNLTLLSLLQGDSVCRVWHNSGRDLYEHKEARMLLIITTQSQSTPLAHMHIWILLINSKDNWVNKVKF